MRTHDFLVGGVQGVREWPRNMTYKKIQEILRCAQILRCLKSKYLSFFPARRVFRYAGMDVTLIISDILESISNHAVQYSPHL